MRKRASGLAVTVRIVVRGSLHLADVCQPWIERAVDVTVSWATRGASEQWGPLTRHAVAAGVTAGGLALVRSFAGPGVSELLEIASGFAVGVIAVSAGVCIARRYSAAGVHIRARSLIAATAIEVAPQHPNVLVLSVRAVLVACEPRAALGRARAALRNPRALLNDGMAQAAVGKVAHVALKSLLLGPVVQLVPGFGPALDIVNACEQGASSMRFIHHFEACAEQLCGLLAA